MRTNKTSVSTSKLPFPLRKMSIIWQKAPECCPDKIFWIILRDSLAKLSVWVSWLLDFVKQFFNDFWWSSNCALLPCCSRHWLSSFKVTLLLLLLSFWLAATLEKFGNSFWIEWESMLKFLLYSTIKTNFWKISPFSSRVFELANKILNVVYRQSTVSFFKPRFVWRLCHVWCIHQNMVMVSFQSAKQVFKMNTDSKIFYTF